MDLIKVLVVDDHALYRNGVASALASQGDLQVVGEAANGEEALSKAQELMPDVILMDISMPVCDGLEATRRITAEVPGAKIIILTAAEQDESLFEAIKSGARGYLLKTIEPRSLVEALRGVFKGEAPISRVTASKILTEFSRQAQRTGTVAQPKTRLTERERELLALLASGTTNKEIAAALGISPSTVKSHLQNIMDKLHLENRVQAAAFALREGLGPGTSAPSK